MEEDEFKCDDDDDDAGKNNGEMMVEEQDVDVFEWEMEKFMLTCGISVFMGTVRKNYL